MTSVQYAIDQNLAPVVSVSYGSCELETPSSESSAFVQWAQQANAQGITWFAASGDDGAADCDDSQNPGLAVDLPGSVPEVTSVGATEFVEGTGTFWSVTNNANGASALSYIPETTWNDSAEDQEPSASGGGASILFSKPAWQTGPGVPSDNARHVPDIALNGSDDHDPYMVYTSGSLQLYGGTSLPTPSFAGLTALLNQKLGSAGVGNINPKLYSLAQSEPRNLSRRHYRQQYRHSGLFPKTAGLREPRRGIQRRRGLRSDDRTGFGGCLQAGDGMERREHHAATGQPEYQRQAA